MPQIITQIDTELHTSWQKELANVVTDPKTLLTLLNLDVEQFQHHFSARKLFPVRVPRPFIARMEKGNIDDPLLKQVMPLNDEYTELAGYISDPLVEHETVAQGLLHKYKHRVLMIVKAGCAVNCRYCFRRHFPYADNSPNKKRWTEALTYIQANDEINEVIFSGGDPLMASDEHLSWLLDKIEQISHVERIRIHTRLPVVIPSRITSKLVAMLSHSRLKSTIVLHINHANEVDNALVNAIEPLKKARIPLFNQSVLLRGINNNVPALVKLNETVFDQGILPYYLHVLDKVQGAAHFDIKEEEARSLLKALAAILPGYMVPKLVREIAGEPNKTPINLA